MARNVDCKCLCHGTDGNVVGDAYWSCKGCYGAMHQHNLHRNPEAKQKAASRPKKPKTEMIGFAALEWLVR